ncbi:hypothetical protein AUC69_11985 [Methyloceanibacter superfactus]|uniref:DUF2939 domain-containing protein n=1 Tax=Methyloceanibacter superfactus TaxID=1774969 RepID=A0A1E3VUY7_9HYPH|nr:DUF2939 domain-containing protein [Methyloceanibacter superfactus]ODR97337.1 hypothetical protein AUC69_11985 [Methyloceanibacter superfactus]
MRTLFVLAVVAVAAYVGYPYLTMYWLDRALLTDDQKSLEQLVDFPRVRADLKADVNAQVLGKAQEIKEKRPILGTFGQALTELFAPDMVDSAVDGMVTPEAILNNPTVVEHRKEDESFADFVTYAFFAAPTRFTFDLKDPEKLDSPTVTAVMALDGFRWRVVGVDLPPLGALLSKVP